MHLIPHSGPTKSGNEKHNQRQKKYLTPSYIDDVLPINNANFANWIPLIDISR